MNSLSLRRGRVAHPEDARVSLCKRGPGQWDGTTGTGHLNDMLFVVIDTWNHLEDVVVVFTREHRGVLE